MKYQLESRGKEKWNERHFPEKRAPETRPYSGKRYGEEDAVRRNADGPVVDFSDFLRCSPLAGCGALADETQVSQLTS